jgi:uncharacterized protein (DUF1684 family)
MANDANFVCECGSAIAVENPRSDYRLLVMCGKCKRQWFVYFRGDGTTDVELAEGLPEPANANR